MDYYEYKKSMKSKKISYSSDEEKIVQSKFGTIKSAANFEWLLNRESDKVKKDEFDCFYIMKKMMRTSKYVDFTIDELKNMAKFLNDNTTDEELEKIDSVNIIDYLYSVAAPRLEENQKLFHENLRKANIEEECKYIDNPEKRPNWRLSDGILTYPRDSRKVEKSISQVDYICEYDIEHRFFNSAINNKNYVEGHHIIPLEFQDEFEEYSLDVCANIVSLCVVCHSKLHHSTFDEKKSILDKIFMQRVDRLKRCNLEIELSDIYKYYKN